MSATEHAMATFGGGCFWCLEAVFEQLDGVERVVSGYAGGDMKHPTYRDVCHGSTGHAEVVQITFDPRRIDYRDLLEIFFAFHDPTTLNRQGPDAGTQYRSVIFHHSEEQQREAALVIKDLGAAKVWTNPIVTQLVPYTEFFAAEDHHQGYYRNHDDQPYCQAMISPKVAKLRAKFASRLKRSSATS